MSESIKGKIWKFGDNISTDLMMPAFLIDRDADINKEERARYCMFSNRPGWAAQVKPEDMIVAGKNFGCGSSRPAAAQLKTLGISIVVAESMSRIFFRNAINLGFPVLICKGILNAFKEGDMAEVEMTSGIIKNLSTGKSLQGETLPADSPPMQVLRAGGILSLLEKKYPVKPL
ncbi:MAG: 3-isopropylmalate dehydratase [Deltaproteobacteria bacterium]|nr:3-isopropylmalate dehydratase [Deltaproteobacteria bacterium]